MAVQTRSLWSGFDPVSGNTASITMTWDDALLRILSFSATNPTTKTILFSATSTSSGKNYSGTILPNTNQTITMTAGAANRLNITVTPSGKLDGVEYRINYG